MSFFTRKKETPVASSAPRVTEQGIEEKIRNTVFSRITGTNTTLCQLTMENDFVIIGVSACVSPENYDEEVGRTLAYEHAFAQLWPLEGYLLAQQRHEAGEGLAVLREAPEAAERPHSGPFGFDVALRHLRNGKRVARKGWNGKGMWVTMIPAFGTLIDGFEVRDCLGLKTAQDQMQVGWLASQSDMLDDDWFLVED